MARKPKHDTSVAQGMTPAQAWSALGPLIRRVLDRDFEIAKRNKRRGEQVAPEQYFTLNFQAQQLQDFAAAARVLQDTHGGQHDDPAL